MVKFLIPEPPLGRKNYRRATYCGWEKKCTKCREWYPADNEFFAKDGKTNDGLFSWCKACNNEHNRLKRETRVERAIRKAHDPYARLLGLNDYG